MYMPMQFKCFSAGSVLKWNCDKKITLYDSF